MPNIPLIPYIPNQDIPNMPNIPSVVLILECLYMKCQLKIILFLIKSK